MTLLTLGAAATALLAVLAVLVAAGRGLRWLVRTGSRLDDVLERTDQMPDVLACLGTLQHDVAQLSGQVTSVSAQLQTAATEQATVVGEHRGRLEQLKLDVDALWGRLRSLESRLA